MPLCTVHLLSLAPTTSIPEFLSILLSQSPPIKPLVSSRVIRWIITPTTITATELLHPPQPWDLLIILPDNNPLPASLSTHIRLSFTLTAGIPSRITKTFAADNPGLLHPDPKSISKANTPSSSPSSKLVASTSQNLELSPNLLEWIRSFSRTLPGRSPVSMLNLLAFHQTESAKQSYQTYGKAFAEHIGSRHGGNAKIVGNIISGSSSGPSGSDYSASGWQEIALAQYPSVSHFAAMLGSPDYQEVNQKYRVPSLRDTCILCTSEIMVEEEIKKWETQRGKGEMGFGDRARGGPKL